MKYAQILVLAVALACCALIAGCTSPSQAEIGTPGTTATPLPPTTTVPAPPVTPVAATASTEQPIVTMPSEQYIDLQLTKDRTDESIHLLYNGGKGAVYVQKIWMNVTLSDGSDPVRYVMNNGDRPQQGNELVVQGTHGVDRCEVWVLSSGTVYKVMDQGIQSIRF